jgi:hypothetical protein
MLSIDSPDPQLPDLIIESVDLQPGDPGINETVRIHPTIRNIGSAPVDVHHLEGTPFWIARHIDGVEPADSAEKSIAFGNAEESRYLGAGEAVTMPNLDFPYPGPGYEMELFVDSDWPDGPYVTESDEANNRLLLRIDDYLDSVPPVPAWVTAVTSQSSYVVGDTVVVEVVIENASNVGATPFHLHYNPEVLRFSDATEGDFLSSAGLTMFLAEDSVGTVAVGLSLVRGVGASGSGTLAFLRFHAIGPGPCEFRFSDAAVKDRQGGNLPAAFEAPAVTVTASP